MIWRGFRNGGFAMLWAWASMLPAQQAIVLDLGAGTYIGAYLAPDGSVHALRQLTIVRTDVPPPPPPPEPPPTLNLEAALSKITEADVRQWLTYLASTELDGRKPNTPGYSKAATYVESLCKGWGLATERQSVPDRDQNVFAYVEGERLKNEVIVVGAHLDHLGSGRLGADDNGSGSTAVLAVAKVFSLLPRGPRTVVFQWYTAEESGLIGSGYYVKNPTFPKGQPSIRSHVAMINLDMVGRLSSRYSEAAFGDRELAVDLKGYVRRLGSKYAFADGITLTSGNRSDHARFLSAGVPSLWLFTGTHGDYHTPRDTVEKINFAGLVQVARYCAELTHLCVHEGQSSTVEPFELKDADLQRIGGEKFGEDG